MADAFEDAGVEMSADTAVPSDTYTEVTNRSWFENVGTAVIAMLIGLLLIPASVALIAWNEGRAVNTTRALAEGSGSVVSAAASPVDAANQNRLVHVTGPLTIPGTLKDPVYGVATPGAATLHRDVQMFQWQQTEHSETRNKVGGGTETVKTYTYAKTWSASASDSKQFKQPEGHANPAFPQRSTTQTAQEGKVGAFTVDAAILGQLAPNVPVAVTAAPPGTVLADNGLYVGANQATPAVGDLRIHFTQAHPPELSVVAKQVDGHLAAYTTRNGRNLLMAQAGAEDAAGMFKDANDQNRMITWLVRAGGAVLMLVGFTLFFAPLGTLASIIPFLGNLVGAGTFVMALLLTLTLAPLVIAIAWLAVRPLLGGGLLAGAAVFAVLTVMALRRRPAPARTPIPA